MGVSHKNLSWGGVVGKETPFHPSLFALSIEPLAQLIRDSKNVPNLMKCLETFGPYSGYKINVSETEALSINN